MEFTIHNQVLLSVFLIATAMGAIVSKTNFCTMGAVSDWAHMGNTGRLRAWLRYLAGGLMFGVGLVVGLAVVAGWAITGGKMGRRGRRTPSSHRGAEPHPGAVLHLHQRHR